MKRKVINFIKEQELIEQNSTVIVGVSGGPDSLSLLQILFEIRDDWNLTLICAHVNHQLRGKESEAEHQFIEAYCDERRILFESRRINIFKDSQIHNRNLHQVARDLRYSFFKDLMNQYEAKYVALGHHGDDLTETMLMRIVRGDKVESWPSILPKRGFEEGFVVRPLLQVTKDEILKYCKDKGLSPKMDSSNFKVKYTRNRFRMNVLPLLKKENPKINEQVLKASTILYEDNTYLEALSLEASHKVIEIKEGNYIVFSRDKLLALPLALQRRVIHLILNYLCFSDKFYSEKQVFTIRQLLEKGSSSFEFHLPENYKLNVSYDVCEIKKQQPEENLEMCVVVDDIGKHQLWDRQQLIISKSTYVPLHKLEPNQYLIHANQLIFPLVVRTPLKGDRIQQAGMHGTKKVRRLFIDSKVPLDERKNWPVVVNGNKEILWLPLLQKVKLKNGKENSQDYYLLTYS